MVPSYCYLMVSKLRDCTTVTADVVTSKPLYDTNTVHRTSICACLSICVTCQVMTAVVASEFQLPAVVWWV